ncbi:MAG: BACON domain-containing protein [Acidobacteria bacterium]|nr:BACON domain-containing protein [Acidobacteriota bacterium]
MFRVSRVRFSSATQATAVSGSSSKNRPASVACTFVISPSKADFGINGGTAMVAVTAPAGCSWTAVSNVAWITIAGVSSTSGNGTVSYSVAVYTGRPKNRNATMTIAGQTFAVKQSR